MTSIFTIGHSRQTAEHFVSLLRANEIERLVDVRFAQRLAHVGELSEARRATKIHKRPVVTAPARS